MFTNWYNFTSNKYFLNISGIIITDIDGDGEFEGMEVPERSSSNIAQNPSAPRAVY
jgi:hypothetical protein